MKKVWTKARRLARSQAYIQMYKEHPEFARKIDRGVSKFWKNNPGIRKIYSKIISKFWTKKERKKQSLRKKRFWKNNPKILDRMDRAVTKWWREHPNIKEKQSRELKAFFMNHPQEFMKKFANSKNNSFAPHIKTKLGLVRSKGEKIIADYLIKNKIPAEYEGKPIMLDGWICVPDFYLKKQKVYIEFYGGYPGSYKKKVLKNKLYKKYKVPVLILTPYELKLWNFKDYLLNKLVRLSAGKKAKKFNLNKWKLK